MPYYLNPESSVVFWEVAFDESVDRALDAVDAADTPLENSEVFGSALDNIQDISQRLKSLTDHVNVENGINTREAQALLKYVAGVDTSFLNELNDRSTLADAAFNAAREALASQGFEIDVRQLRSVQASYSQIAGTVSAYHSFFFTSESRSRHDYPQGLLGLLQFFGEGTLEFASVIPGLPTNVATVIRLANTAINAVDTLRNSEDTVAKAGAAFTLVRDFTRLVETIYDGLRTEVKEVERGEKSFLDSSFVDTDTAIDFYVTFNDGSIYRWQSQFVGLDTIQQMISLAEAHDGLGSFIYHRVRYLYS